MAVCLWLCVQRDLKPQNLLVTSNWTVKVGASEGCRGLEGAGGGRGGAGGGMTRLKGVGGGWRQRWRRNMEGTATCAHARTDTSSIPSPPHCYSRPLVPRRTPCP